MVDVMVLGNSLQEHGVKAEKLLCINDDTELNSIAHLMRSFWQFVPVHHVPLPRHLRGSEQSRLQGVYSKLQTVNLFSSGCLRQQRFLLMDADMLVRANLDDVFAYEVPAGVMRGEADSCLFVPRPSHTYFHPDTTMRPGASHPPMKGGINGGLVLFEPSADTYKDMMDELHDFRPKTKWPSKGFSVITGVAVVLGTRYTRNTTSRSTSCTLQVRRHHRVRTDRARSPTTPRRHTAH